MRTVDLYARKSTTDAGRSVARQERAWRSDCVEEGLEPGLVFVDPDLSASRYSTKTRPDYEALIRHIESSKCEMVSLWETSRGSRKMGEWVSFLDLCRDKGVLIRVFGEGSEYTYDPRRQRDRDALITEGMAAEGEVERLRSRSKAGALDAAAQGRPPGPLSDGYKRIYGAPSGDSLSLSGARRKQISQVVDEERAQIYRWAAEGVLNGVPVHTIARILNAFEIPTASGRGSWMGGRLKATLLRPTLQGHRVLAGEIVARDAWPAILDVTTVAKLRRAWDVRTMAHADNRLKHLLSGVMTCGLCSKPMSHRLLKRNGRVQRRYWCEMTNRGGCGRVSGPSVQIDAFVGEMVVRRLRQPDALTVFEADRDDGELLAAQAELDALTSRRMELTTAAAKPGGPSMMLVAAAEKELLPQIETVSKRLRALRTPPALQAFDPVDLAVNWDSYPVGERRLVVSALTELTLMPAEPRVGRGWKVNRLASSRWRGHAMTWGDLWVGGVAG